MSRSQWIFNADGFTRHDDLIPRCMDAAAAPRATFCGPDKLPKTWSAAFTARVEDAKKKLRRGVPVDEVCAVHGRIVVKTAAHEIMPKAKIIA